MYSYSLKKIIYPVLQLKYPQLKNTMNHLQLLEKTQWWKPLEIKQLQQKRLRSILIYAYENVPYYHKIFKTIGLKPADIKNPSNLEKIPLLTKEIIKKNLNDLKSNKYPLKNFSPSATSGSAGEPMKFFIDTDWKAWNMAAALREWSWTGYNIGDKMAYLWSSPEDISRQIVLKNKLFNLLQRTIYLDALQITEKTLEKYIKILRNFNPKVINAYASAIYLMARYMKNKNITDIQPKAILTSCEMLFDHQRAVIEDVFGCKVFDYYSGRETTFHAGECPEHIGYHMAIENAVIELIKDGEQVSPGESGKIIITDLSNYAMPFIRYEIGDLGIQSDERCPCGRGLPLMKEISGRIRDIVTTKNGRYITGAFFSTLFYDKHGGTKGVKQYQFIQKTKNHSILKIIKDEDFSKTEFEKIIEKIQRHCGDMTIEIEFVDEIQPTISGKYRTTISEVEIRI